MITLEGSKTGMTTTAICETSEETETLISALGGEDGCRRQGQKAETIRKRLRARLPGARCYWEARLFDNITRLTARIEEKGHQSVLSALEWGLTHAQVYRAAQAANRPDVLTWWRRTLLPAYLTSKQVAAQLDITTSTMRVLAHKGKIEQAPEDLWPDRRTPLYVSRSVERYAASRHDDGRRQRQPEVIEN